MALVRERHGNVRQTFDALLNAYAVGDKQQIIAANESFRTALHNLEAVVAAEHWPVWLRDLVLNADRYASRHSNGIATWRAHLESAINNAAALNAEDWSFTEEEDVLFDADAIVAKARSDYKIDQLYHQVIACLQQLLDSGEIDSLRASNDLRRLIATLRIANSGSFSAQVFNWRFARRLVPNLICAYIKRSNVTGPIIDAFEQTASELDVSLERAKDQISADILSAAAKVLRTEAGLTTTQEPLLFLEDQSGANRLVEGVDFEEPADQ
jgi:hypothetical protein